MSALKLSHLFVRVSDTDAMIDFYCKGLGGVLESDKQLSAPALDAIFGREGVRIRETFIVIDVLRLHTIESLDVPYPKADPKTPKDPMALGIGGISFRVPDLDEAHQRMQAEGRNPTPIFDFDQLDEPVRMFFLDDPDGNRLEMIDSTPSVSD